MKAVTTIKNTVRKTVSVLLASVLLVPALSVASASALLTTPDPTLFTIGTTCADPAYATTHMVECFPPPAATDTTTTLQSAPNPAYTTDSITFTATVGPGNPQGGTVAFSYVGDSHDNTVIPGCDAVNLKNVSDPETDITTSQAECTAKLPADFYTVTATYSGVEGTYNGSEDSTSQDVYEQRTPAITVTHIPAAYPNAGTDKATLSDPVTGSDLLGETISFSSGCTADITAHVDGNYALCDTPDYNSGPQTVTAYYDGNTLGSIEYAAVDASASYTNYMQDTSITIASDHVGGATAGQAVTFSSTLTIASPLEGNFFRGPKTVTYFDGNTPIAGCENVPLSGLTDLTFWGFTFTTITGPMTASCTTATLSVGSHTITVDYAGDSQSYVNGPSSASLTQVINALPVVVVTPPTTTTTETPPKVTPTIPVVTTTSTNETTSSDGTTPPTGTPQVLAAITSKPKVVTNVSNQTTNDGKGFWQALADFVTSWGGVLGLLLILAFLYFFFRRRENDENA